MGLGQVEIGNIDLNLFRGKLSLEEVALYKSAARVFSLERADFDLSILSLLEQRLHLQSLSLRGLSVTVKQDEGQPLQVAGIVLPQGEPEKKESSDSETPQSWSLGIDGLKIQDSAIQIILPQFTETIELEDISLGALAMWRPDYITPLHLHIGVRNGELNLKAKSNPFAQFPEHQVELNLSGLQLETFAGLAQPMLLVLRGELSSQMTVKLQQTPEQIISLSQQGNLSLHDFRVQSGETTLENKTLLWNGQATSTDLNDVNALNIQGSLKLSATGLVEGEQSAPALFLQDLSLSELKLQGVRSITLADVGIDGLKAEAIRTSEGVMLSGLPKSTDKKPPSEEGAKEELQQGDATPVAFRVERLRLTGENRLTFDDQTVKPTFRHTITLTEAELQPIDNSQPEQPTKIMVKGKDDYYTNFTIEGESKPFTPQLALNLTAKLSGFDMPPTSPYLAQLLGYRITTGQLDSDIEMLIENNEMKGALDLRMNQLQLEAEDPARIEEFQSKTVMPLNTALSLLRDKNDNIKLNLPVSGKLDDPEFALDDIINTALGKALKAGSVSYLKHLLQPYGTLITIVQLAGKAAGQVQLEPVSFAAGSSALTPEAEDYLAKMKQLIEKEGINMHLCGYANTADLAIMSKGKEKTIPPAGHPALEGLAKQRAEKIKSTLVNRYGAKPNQLFICHPDLDRTAEGNPRVEINL
jgi:hypothetical protein